MKIQHEGRIIDLDALLVASEDMLRTLSNLTTAEFELGAEREERRALATALGLDPNDYSL